MISTFNDYAPSRKTQKPSLMRELVGLDIVFILIAAAMIVLQAQGMIAERPKILRLTSDFGLPEVFNFVKWGIGIGALAYAWFRSRRIGYAFVAIALLLLLADDSLQLHEQAGWKVQYWLNIQAYTDLPRGPTGQVFYGAALGAVVFGLIWLAWRRTETQSDERHYLNVMVILMIALGVFGVIIDFGHSVLKSHIGSGTIDRFAGLVENGGELVVTSLICATCLMMAVRAAAAGRSGS